MDQGAGWGIHLLDPDDPAQLEPLVVSEASEWGPDISPDGKWFAYTSDESGRYEIYARAFASDRSWTVSLEGGEEPIEPREVECRKRFPAMLLRQPSQNGTPFEPSAQTRNAVNQGRNRLAETVCPVEPGHGDLNQCGQRRKRFEERENFAQLGKPRHQIERQAKDVKGVEPALRRLALGLPS